jgi:hypothetical protein
MGFHFPPHIELRRLQSNLELDYQLPPDSNVVALPLGKAREWTESRRYPRKARIIPLAVVPPVVSLDEDENSPPSAA